MELERYRDLFLTESKKQLDGLKSLFNDIEKNSSDFDKIKESMRLAHTLKGMAGMMSFDKLTKVSQQMEETINAFCINNKEMNKETVKILSKGLSVLYDLVADVKENKDSNIQIDEVLNEIKKIKS